MAKAALGRLVTSMGRMAERAEMVTVLHCRGHGMARLQAGGLAARAVHHHPVRLQASYLGQDGFAKLKAF